MAAPRQALNPATHSVGFTAKLVTVRSVSADGKSAVCVDRQNTQTTVSMLVQRSKASLPAPGETWLLTQDLGMWLFAAIVATSSGQFLGSEGTTPGGTRVTVSATAPASPATGDIWVNAASGNAVFWWSGVAWTSAQFGTQAIADRAVTRAKIAGGAVTAAEIDPHAGITAGQVAFTATDIGGVRVFKGTSQPPNPGQGDLWINPDRGNAIYFWDTDRWTQLQLGAAAIVPGSLTSFQISPDAGITNGQVDFTARDIGGITTSVSSVQPSSPAVGDLWFDGTSSYALKQWNGTAWALFQFGTNAIAALSVTAALIAANTITAAQIAAGTITATQIAAGTITATQLAAGIIYAGIVNGTTINGAQFIAHGSSGEILVYSGTPALGNLIASTSAAPGNDVPGNAYLQGVVTYINLGGGSFAATQHLDDGLVFLTAPAASGPWIAAGSAVQWTSGALFISHANSIVLSSFVEVQGDAQFNDSITATAGTASSPTVITTDSFNPITGLTNGWTVTPGQLAQYMLMPDDSVWIIADLTAGTIAGGTNVWTIPTGPPSYAPAAPQNLKCILAASTAAAQAVDPYFTVSAHLQIHNAVTGQTRFIINDKYPLH